MKTAIPFYCLLLFGTLAVLPLQAQRAAKRGLTSLRMEYDSNRDLLRSRSVHLNFIATYANGKTRSSDQLYFRHLWMDRFRISVKNGRWIRIENTILYNLEEVYLGGGKIEISLQEKRGEKKVYQFEIVFGKLVEVMASYDSLAFRSPGYPVRVQLTAKFDNGQLISSRNGNADNKLIWQYFDVQTNVGFTDNQELWLSQAEYLKTDTFRFQAFSKTDTTIRSNILKIPLDYNGPQFFDFSGRNAQYYSGSGTDGHHVNVWVQKVSYKDKPLLRIRATSNEKSFETLLNPELGKLVIDCRGGAGRDGEDGINGSNGIDSDDDACDTDGENGTDGGSGGNGGDVFFYTDAEAGTYLHLIEVLNTGGVAGAGGARGNGGTGGDTANNGSDGYAGSGGQSGLHGRDPQVIWVPKSSLSAAFIEKIR